jgi:hypothetical protein
MAQTVRAARFSVRYVPNGVFSILLILFAIAQPANSAPIEIPAGFDHFQTFPAGTEFNLALPGGFFNIEGSDSNSFGPMDVAFIGFPGGLPKFPFTPIIVPEGPGCHSHSAGGTHCNAKVISPAEADTVVERLDTLSLEIGESGVTGTDLVGLSMISASPIIVGFEDGFFEEFNVFVSLRESLAGSMMVTRTGVDTFTFATEAPMQANVRFQFVRVADPTFTNFLDVDGVIELTEPWEVQLVPEPSTLGLTLIGIAAAAGYRRKRRSSRT